MAGRDRTINEPVVQELWSVAIPRVGCSVESAEFQLDGQFWKFKLETVWDGKYNDLTWEMSLIKKDSTRNFQSFCLRAYVRSATSDLYMAHREISGTYTVIWSCRRRSFSASYPSIQVTAMLDFSFRIVPLRKDFQRFANEPGQTLPHAEGHPCLDNLSLALRKLVDEGSDSDVQLKCGECSVAAHALILGMRSEVFRAMLERREGAIEIVDMEPKVFEIFIRYLYTGTLPELAEDTATSLYEAADKYLVEALRQRCGDFLAGNLTRENALRILAMADAHSDKDLKDKVGTYVMLEKIPGNEDEWSKFCDDHPKLAIEVLNLAYKSTTCVL